MFLNNVLPACFKFNSYSSQELLCSREEPPPPELAELSFAEPQATGGTQLKPGLVGVPFSPPNHMPRPEAPAKR